MTAIANIAPRLLSSLSAIDVVARAVADGQPALEDLSRLMLNCGAFCFQDAVIMTGTKPELPFKISSLARIDLGADGRAHPGY